MSVSTIPTPVPIHDDECRRRLASLFDALDVCRPALQTAIATGLAQTWANDPRDPGWAIVDCGTTYLAGFANAHHLAAIVDFVGTGKRIVPADRATRHSLTELAKKRRVVAETRTWFADVAAPAPEAADAERLQPHDWQRFRREIDIDLSWGFASAEDFFARGAAYAVSRRGRWVSAAATVAVANTEWEIGVFTAPNWRGRGLAKRAARSLLVEAAKAGAKSSWDAIDARSAAFARSLGFQQASPYACFRT